MSSRWITVAPGIRCRDHEGRKHGVKADRYFTLRFYKDGKRVEEALGWASDGWTRKRAQDELGKLREAKRTGDGEKSLRDRRVVAETTRREKARCSEAETQRVEEEARRNVTLATYFTETYEPWAKATKAKAFVRESGIWRVWLNPTLGPIPINDIRIEQWDHLVKTLAAAGLSERSREYITGTLRRIVKHARERRVVTEAPPTGKMVGSTAPKNNRRLRTLTDEDLQTLLAKLKDRDINAWRVTLFAAGTGCRASEAYNLRWGTVSPKAGTATFPKTKNGASRTVPLGREILAMLGAMTPGGHNDLVFPNQRGGAYCSAPSSFEKVVADLQLNEGRGELDRFSFHSLRHMAATRLARVLPLRGLMDMLGWTVAAMALRYSHTGDEDRRRAAEALDTAFRPADGAEIVTFPRQSA